MEDKNWTAKERFDELTTGEAVVWGDDGDLVAIVFPNLAYEIEAIDRAKKIVHRVKNFDRLVEALEAIDLLCEEAMKVSPDPESAIFLKLVTTKNSLWNQVKAALTAAKEV